MAAQSTNRRVMIQGGLVAGLVAVYASGCGEIRYRDTISPDKAVTRVVVEGDVGVMELVPSETARVDYAVRAPEGAAHIQHTEFDGVLHVTARCRTPILCSVDAEIHVPEGVPVEVSLASGEVWATGVGSIDVSIGQGSADIESSGRTTIQVGNGTARVVSTNSEQLRVAVGQGDIDVLVSPDVWNVAVVAASESLRGIVHDATATGSLELVAPAGLVSVRSLNALTQR